MATEQEQLLWAMLASTAGQQGEDPELAEAKRLSELEAVQRISLESDAMDEVRRASLAIHELELAKQRSKESDAMDEAQRASLAVHAFELAKQRSKQSYFNDYMKEVDLRDQEDKNFEEALRLSLLIDNRSGLDQKHQKETSTIAYSQSSSAQSKIDIVPGTAASSSSQSSSSSMSSSVSGSNIGQAVQEARIRRQQLQGSK